MPLPSKKTQDALHRLHRAYVEKLPEKITDLSERWAQAVTEAYVDQALLNDLHLEAHSLSGSGATYGLVQVSETLAHLEDRIQKICEPGTPTPEEREDVEVLLNRLHALAEILPDAPLPSFAAPNDRQAMPLRSRQPLVLIVDDTVAVRQRLRVGFEADGFQVLEAANGEQALDRAKAHPPDVIILDVRMPGMDGFEVQRRLREEPSLAHTYIFFLTSTRSLNVQKIKTALAYGIKGYIPKTMPLPEIVAKARSVLTS